MNFTGVATDLNGVLWWDNHLQEQAWRQISAQNRDQPFSGEKVVVHVDARISWYTLGKLGGRTSSASGLEQHCELKETLNRRLCTDQGLAFEVSLGAIELLDALAAGGNARSFATAFGQGHSQL